MKKRKKNWYESREILEKKKKQENEKTRVPYSMPKERWRNFSVRWNTT